jgi:hypothetical protein
VIELTTWMYISRSNLMPETASAAVKDIVTRSVSYNSLQLVTGALIFTGERFAQLIEGPAEAVARLRSAITADPRHRDLVRLTPLSSGSRRFAGWSLAYCGPSHFVNTAVERALRASGGERRVAVSNLTNLMLAFVA